MSVGVNVSVITGRPVVIRVSGVVLLRARDIAPTGDVAWLLEHLLADCKLKYRGSVAILGYNWPGYLSPRYASDRPAYLTL